jgi:hypothetical protein
VFHEMNLSCIVLTLHDPDPKLNLNDFCRSQERHRPACPGYSSLNAPPQALDTGVRPIRQHSRWPSHPISISRSGRNVPVLCQPALSDRGDEQWRGRSPTPPPPQGGLLPGAVRCGSAFMGEKRLIDRYSSGPRSGRGR